MEIKKLTKFIALSNLESQDEQEQLNQRITACLAKIYFEEKVKHPVKSIIQRYALNRQILISFLISMLLVA